MTSARTSSADSWCGVRDRRDATVTIRHAGRLAQIAAMLGEEADAAKYAELAGSVRQAFQDEYISPRGRIVSDTQTAYALALQFGLLPDADQRARAGKRLVELVRAKGHHVEMTSFNHYAFGAVADWMHRVTAGSPQPRPATGNCVLNHVPAAASPGPGPRT